MSWNGQQSYPQAAMGHMATARQQKRSQSQARYNAHNADDQQDGWFGQRDKPAKATRLDIVTDYQQALHQANGVNVSAVNGVSSMAGASSISEQRTTSASVTMELMAKQQRQREAKEQAEAAQRRRADALRAAEQAEEEYLRACEAERLAFQDGDSGAAPPPPPEETQAQPAARSQQMTDTNAAIDVSQDEVLQEWSRSADELKRQWAAWYISNPSEWIEYKSQYASKQTQQQPQQGGTQSASPSQPQVLAQASPEGKPVQHSHTHASASHPLQHVPHQQFSPQQVPQAQPSQQQSLQQQPWQQQPWQPTQQPQQQHERSPYHQAAGDTQPQQWAPPSFAQAPASISTSAPSPSQMQPLQNPPWLSVSQQNQPKRDQQHPTPQTHPHPASHMADRAADGTGASRTDTTAPWHAAPQPSAPAAFVHPGHSSGPVQLAPPTHSSPHAPGPWNAAPGPRGHAVAPMLDQGPPNARGQHGSAPQPLAQLEQQPVALPPAPSVSQAPTGPHNGGHPGAPPPGMRGGSEADRQLGGAANRSPERPRHGERPQGFVRGTRHKPAPPPAAQSGPRNRNGSGGPGAGHAWPPQQEPVGSGSTPGFTADPIAAVRPPAPPGLQPSQPRGGVAAGNLPQSQPRPQLWPPQSALPQPPAPGGPSGAQRPWISSAPHGPAGGPQGPGGAPPAPSLQAPAPSQRPPGQGSWQPRPSGGGPPASPPGLPAPGPWQAPHAGDAAGVRGAAPPLGPPTASPAPLGPPRPLAGGLSMAPPGVMQTMGAVPPGMQPVRPQPRAPQGAAPTRPHMMPPPQAHANPAGSLPDPAGTDGGVRPRGEFDMPSSKPGGSPTPRPGPMYGMHSPQGKGVVPAQPRHSQAAGIPPAQPGAGQSIRYGGGMVQPSNAPQGVRGAPGPYQGRPMLGDGPVRPAGPGGPGPPGFRPPGFMPAMQQGPGPRFQGQPPGRPPREMLNGPPHGPMGGPNMHGRPGMVHALPSGPNGPYMSPPPHARPPF